jgi:hypothetical protein
VSAEGCPTLGQAECADGNASLARGTRSDRWPAPARRQRRSRGQDGTRDAWAVAVRACTRTMRCLTELTMRRTSERVTSALRYRLRRLRRAPHVARCAASTHLGFGTAVIERLRCHDPRVACHDGRNELRFPEEQVKRVTERVLAGAAPARQ